MSAAINYNDLALSWTLESKTDRRYNLITVIVVILMLSAAFIMSSVELPEEERQLRQEIPPRIANFLLEKKKVEPKVQRTQTQTQAQAQAQTKAQTDTQSKKDSGI